MRNRRWINRGLMEGVPLQIKISETEDLRALVSRDKGRWHLSLSCREDRYPTWDELADARYDLLPHDVDMAMILPPPGDYVNAHRYVLQLHEVRDDEMVVDRGVGQIRTRETMDGSPGKETWPGPFDHMKEVRT